MCGPTDKVYSWLSGILVTRGVHSWGNVLDAGTGRASICWIARHNVTHVDAVTATSSGTYSQETVQRAAHRRTRATVNVVLGNWRDKSLLAGRQYDVVVADFLLGAVEMFWPYSQDAMLDRLFEMVRPGGYLLFVGLEPYDLLFEPKDVARRFEALGDAAALLSGGGSYRELPQEWVERQLTRKGSGFQVVSSKRFSSSLGPSYAHSQLEFATDQAKNLKNKRLRGAFLRSVSAMEDEAAGFSAWGQNYAIVARRERAA